MKKVDSRSLASCSYYLPLDPLTRTILLLPFLLSYGMLILYDYLWHWERRVTRSGYKHNYRPAAWESTACGFIKSTSRLLLYKISLLDYKTLALNLWSRRGKCLIETTECLCYNLPRDGSRYAYSSAFYLITKH